MTAPHRTAYPRFPQRYAEHDLQAAYTPTDDEVAFARREARLPQHQLSLLILLKVFQNLGHFPGQYEHCCNQTQSSSFCPSLMPQTWHVNMYVLMDYAHS